MTAKQKTPTRTYEHTHSVELSVAAKALSPCVCEGWPRLSLMFQGICNNDRSPVRSLPLLMMSSIQRALSKAGQVAGVLSTLPLTPCYPGRPVLTAGDNPTQPSPSQPLHRPAEPQVSPQSPRVSLSRDLEMGKGSPRHARKECRERSLAWYLGIALCSPRGSQRERPC